MFCSELVCVKRKKHFNLKCGTTHIENTDTVFRSFFQKQKFLGGMVPFVHLVSKQILAQWEKPASFVIVQQTNRGCPGRCAAAHRTRTTCKSSWKRLLPSADVGATNHRSSGLLVFFVQGQYIFSGFFFNKVQAVYLTARSSHKVSRVVRTKWIFHPARRHVPYKKLRESLSPTSARIPHRPNAWHACHACTKLKTYLGSAIRCTLWAIWETSRL